jgi:hypothetical protein
MPVGNKPTPEQLELIVDDYFEALAPLGAELADLALRRARQGCEFFPTPAKIHDLVAGELEQRAEERARVARERLMLPAPRRPDPTPEEIAYAEARAGECRRILAGAGAVITEKTAASMIEPPPPHPDEVAAMLEGWRKELGIADEEAAE